MAEQWYQGWGFWYLSPDGSVNHATATSITDPRNGGVITPLHPNTNPTLPKPAPAPATTAPAPGTSEADKSARAILDQTLGQYGLQSLGDTVWKWYLNGKSVDQIMLDMRNTAEYKQRFPAMAALSAKGHAMSETEYINYEESATAMMRAAGLPTGMYDKPDDFTKFLTNEVGLPELQTRIDLNKQAAFEAPQEVKDELQRLYGVGPGGLTAFFIDPNKALPLLQRDFIAAQDSGAALRTGYGGLSQTEAERLAALGITPDQAQQGFTKLQSESQLFSTLPGEGGNAITRASQLSAEFGGNAAAQQEIENRQRQRLAAFQGDTEFAGGQTGSSGLGTAK